MFGKLLASDSSAVTLGESKRTSYHANGQNGSNSNGSATNETDLREHMVGILFSQSGKLSELQKQVNLTIFKFDFYSFFTLGLFSHCPRDSP